MSQKYTTAEEWDWQNEGIPDFLSKIVGTQAKDIIFKISDHISGGDKVIIKRDMSFLYKERFDALGNRMPAPNPDLYDKHHLVVIDKDQKITHDFGTVSYLPTMQGVDND